MSHTLTIRLQDDLARWLEDAARRTGVSQGQLVRNELERARQGKGRGRPFMRLAGSVRLASDLSSRKGFAKS